MKQPVWAWLITAIALSALTGAMLQRIDTVSSQEADLWTAIQKLFDSHRVIAQRGDFDAYWCWLRDRIRIRVWLDTLLAHHTLYPQLPHDLGYLTAQYTTHPYYKGEGDYWKEGGDIDEFLDIQL